MSQRKKQPERMQAGPAQPAAEGGRYLFGFLVLAVLTVAAYGPALQAGFVWDDDTMLTQNPLIKAADGLAKFWATTQAPDYWPATSSTLWVEWRLWGLHAAGYHATNVALHVIEAGMLWGILRQLRIPGAYFAALLYAVHPVNVESVAWIAQRKNLMAMLFYLASLRCFLKAESPPAGRPGTGYYVLSLFGFLLAMLSKGSVAMMPVILVGLILWRRRLTGRDCLRLSPFFAIALVLTIVDVWFQRHGTGEVIRQAGAVERLLGAGGVVWFYLSKSLWPARLIFVYPAWRIDPADLLWWLPVLAAAAVTVGLVLLARRPGPRVGLWRALLYAWEYFCVMLVPVMGFTDVYFMKYSLVADHYEHMALIGVLGAVGAAWGSVRMRAKGGQSFLWMAAAGMAVLLLAAQTWAQCRSYRDSETLFRDTLARNPTAWMAEGNLGLTLAAEGRTAEAIAHYEAALKLKPDYPESLNNLGIAREAQGRLDEAMADYRAALRIRPNFAEAHSDLSDALNLAGRLPEAIAEAQAALNINPDYAEAENNLGNALGNANRAAESLPHFRHAVALDPTNATYEGNFGVNLFRAGQVSESLAHLGRAVALDPGNVQFHVNLGKILRGVGRPAEAEAQFAIVHRLAPGFKLEP